MRVAVLANLKKNAPTWEGMLPDQWDDLDSEKTVDSLLGALCSGGHEATFLEGDLALLDNLRLLKPDICFNICEGHFGDARESHVPALLEMLRIPYTGSRVTALALALDKPMTKRVLAYHGLPTPSFQVFARVDDALEPKMAFPLFVKPSREGTGMGVMADSVVHDETQLRAKLRQIVDRYQQPALVERFIDGREVTVGLVGNCASSVIARGWESQHNACHGEGIHVFPAMELDMARYPAEEGGIYSNRLKVELADDFHILCPAPLRADQVAELNWLTAEVFRVIGCHDVARVDYRLDATDNDRPYILEINPLPGLNPGYSDLCLEAAADGWSYEQLINRILEEAAHRFGLCQN
jgi:D-alanine-D-alanine ligase